MSDAPSRDEVERKARALGLDRLADEHLDELVKAEAAMRGVLERMPKGLRPADEPAHVYRAGEED